MCTTNQITKNTTGSFSIQIFMCVLMGLEKKLSYSQAANIPLDLRQLDWLVRKFDKKCTAIINYRLVCELVYM